MKKRIFIQLFLVSLAALLLCSVISAAIIGTVQERELTDTAAAEAGAALRQYDLSEDPAGLARRLADLFQSYRITIIAPDGTVTGDSLADPSSMENHLGRPEVAAAAAGRIGVDMRRSGTLDTRMLYIARADEDGSILRIAVAGSTLRQNLRRIFPAFLLGILAALAFSALLARRSARALLHPLNETAALLRQTAEEPGAPEVPPAGFDELDGIVSSINAMSQRISRGVQELSYEKEKTSFILSHMEEGVLLIDRALNVLYFNRSAALLMEVRNFETGQNLSLLTHHVRVLEAVQEAMQGSSLLFDYTPYGDSGTVLAIKVSPAAFDRGERAPGVLMVISDVTELRRTEQIRSEFVANASHELKTPITSIRGFAELLSSGVVRDPEKEKDYLGRIVKESERMMTLTEDILMLSALESGLRPTPSVPLSLLGAAREAAEDLSPQARERQVEIDVSGDDCSLLIDPADLRHILVNLMENGVRYNRPGGRVSVTVKRLPSSILLMVEDTGIGIPARYQTRVFERFFRVDKGRSRNMGGTGLGLAIVRHTVSLYQGEIALVSREGSGTRIQIRFPLSMDGPSHLE
ncbi:MAG: ATP-binding protein [Oscillospiraceae bacterium]|nr:ATP-binding protein [Oscillospiraceae bacterium]